MPGDMTDTEREARVEEMQTSYGTNPRIVTLEGDDVRFLLTELERVKALRDRLVLEGLGAVQEALETAATFKAERDALKEQHGRLVLHYGSLARDAGRAMDQERDAALAEVARLREALNYAKKILDAGHPLTLERIRAWLSTDLAAPEPKP